MDNNFPLALPVETVLAGQYIIKKTLGQGGFGITYMAINYKTNEKVAIKEFYPDTLATRTQNMVVPHTGDSGESYQYGLSCFLQEAQTLAEFIGIDGIVKIHSYFEENGTAYFVMDFVEGQSFEEYIKSKGGKISYEEAEQILVPVMDALSAVHKRGIIHRDVTPDNIYITKERNVKLLDFGAARYSLGDKSRSLDVVLKHGFAPKEQYTRHGKQGPFTDIYSLGATFYFAITGKRPIDSIDRLEEDDLIPPGNLGVSIPGAKEDAILKALAVQPAERFQTMEAFKQALLGESAPIDNSQPSGQSQEVQQVVFTAPTTPVQNQQMNYGTTMQQPQNQQMPYMVNPNQGMQNTSKKKNILPVLLGVAVGIIGMFVVVMIAGSNINKNKAEKESISAQREVEDNADNNDRDKSDQAHEDQDKEKEDGKEAETELPIDLEPSEPENVNTAEVGTFDSLTVNNVVNIGKMGCSEEYNMWMAVPNVGLMHAARGNVGIKYRTSEYIESINLVGDKVYFVNGGKEKYYSITDDEVCELQEIPGIEAVYYSIVNEYGRFVTAEDKSGNYCLIYVSQNDSDNPCYYNIYSPVGVAIMDDYIYFMSEDGHGIDRCRIADFGKGGRERFFYRDDIIISRFVAEGKYVYFYSEKTDEGKGCICRVDRDDPSDIYYTILDFKDDVSITALNVYNGYVYYAISSQQSDQYRSNIIGITTHGDDGWSDSDIKKLCSIEDNYAVCGITFDPYQNSSMILGITPDGNEICAGSNMDFTDSLMVLY